MDMYFYNQPVCHSTSETDSLIYKSMEKSFPGESFFLHREKNGKPSFLPKKAYVGVTNAENTVLIALSRHNFGIDMEPKARIVSDFCAVKKRFFTKREAQFSQTNEKFLEIWVKKEAYCKFTGGGLSSFKSFDVFSLCGEFTLHPHPHFLIYTYSPKSKESTD